MCREGGQQAVGGPIVSQRPLKVSHSSRQWSYLCKQVHVNIPHTCHMVEEKTHPSSSL